MVSVLCVCVCVLPGADWHCFSQAVISLMTSSKVVSDLRRNALHVVRQVAESGAGTPATAAPLICHAVRAAWCVFVKCGCGGDGGPSLGPGVDGRCMWPWG